MARADRTRRIARLISVLSGNKKGSTITQIVKATGTSKATAYRDLELVRESGYTLETATRNGEALYTLVASDFAREAMTTREHASLLLARRALSGVEGTWLARELDTILKRAQAVQPDDSGILLSLGLLAYDPRVLAVLHEAVTARRVARIRYRGASDKNAETRTVHPMRLHIVDQQPYLLGWDEKKRDVRTFKVARVSQAKLLRSKARVPANAEEPPDPKAGSVKTWRSSPMDVRIRIAAPVARFVHEWPLVATQALEGTPRGAIDVCARVYGLQETLRWVLRWGKNAVVIEPRELRKAVEEELRAALDGYRESGVRGRRRGTG